MTPFLRTAYYMEMYPRHGLFEPLRVHFLWDHSTHCGIFENGVLLMYTLEDVTELQTSLLLMKSLNKTDTPIFFSAMCSLFPKAMFFMFINHCTKSGSKKRYFKDFIVRFSTQ